MFKEFALIEIYCKCDLDTLEPAQTQLVEMCQGRPVVSWYEDECIRLDEEDVEHRKKNHKCDKLWAQ